MTVNVMNTLPKFMVAVSGSLKFVFQQNELFLLGCENLVIAITDSNDREAFNENAMEINQNRKVTVTINGGNTVDDN